MIRDITPADFDAILTLNEELVDMLSPLDRSQLARLHDSAAYHRGIEQDGELVAFLLALREGTDYRSANYRWFCERRRNFLYIDRVAVRPDQQRRNRGRSLYRDVIAYADRQRCAHLVCEFNLVPLNEASRAFHDSFGFREVGSQWVNDGARKVSLQELPLSPGAEP